MSNVGPEMKTVIALSRRYDDNVAAQLNAVGHIAQALGRGTTDLRLANYRTAEGQVLGALSWWPLIILAGRPAKIAELWAALQGRLWPKACFVETMISGGTDVQLAATARLRWNDIPIVALGVHAPAADLTALTRKLSLWKARNG